jgi:hypothetical protein
MARGGKRDGAGRTKGKANKDKQALKDALAALYPRWDPVLAMAKIANTKGVDPAMNLQACKEVAQYIHPKLKSVEHKGEIQKRITIVDYDGDSEDPSA